MPFISSRRIFSTMLVLSTNSRQSVDSKNRRLLILLLIETWSAACFWFSCCISSSVVKPYSANCCSNQLTGNERLFPFSSKRLVNSATKELSIGGSDRARSAIIRTRFFGLVSAVEINLSAHSPASDLLMRSIKICIEIRRRFSNKDNLSIIGNAHNSPIFKKVVV